MLDYRYLKAFILTAEHSSFSKAATNLKIAQSAVSRQIKLMEQALGCELIIRSSKKVILTDKGKELFLASKNFEETTKDIFENESTQTIRIGVLQGLLENWLHKVLDDYYKENDNNISIKVGAPTELKRLLQDGKLDITFSNDNIQTELISSLKLFDENLVMISKEKIEASKIHKQRWIIYNNEDNLLKAYKRKSGQILQVDSITTIIKTVQAGIGIAIVPDHVLDEKIKKSLFIQKFSGPKRSEIFMSTLNYKSMPKHLKELTLRVRKHS